jgi:hypothetical protein
MSPARHRQFMIAACASALAFGFVACATADGTVGDVDAGGQDEGGPTATSDTGATPPKKDAGSGGGGDLDSGDPGTPEASVCVKAPPSSKCGVAPQCGCAPTETCDVLDNAGNVDCIAAGTAAPGKACTTTAGCALGSTCISGACKPYCPAGVSADGGGGACGIKGTSTCVHVGPPGKPIPNLSVCRIACDLVNPTSCDVLNAPAGIVGCDLDSTNQPDCFTAAATNPPSCASARCAPANVCVTLANDAGSVCKKWCKVGDNTPCGAGTCSGFGTKLLVNGVEYGACP